MTRSRRATMLILALGLILPSSASQFFQAEIGPTWPTDLQYTRNPVAWNASLAGGHIIDDKLGFGLALDFLWNTFDNEQKITGSEYQILESQKTYMFPVSGFMSITPFPQWIVSPTLWGQVGWNNMYFSHDSSSNQANSQGYSENGWYMGVLWKLAADAQYNFGESTALFVGAEYRWATLNKLAVTSSDITIRRDMSGFGIRAGFRVSY